MKVIFKDASSAQVAWGGGEDPREYLTKGETYEVKKVEEHSWYTLYHLKGIKGGFNSVCFEVVEEV